MFVFHLVFLSFWSLLLSGRSNASLNIKHFVDLAWDLEPAAIDFDSLKAIIRDKARQELPEVLTLKEHPTFSFLSQFFLFLQNEGKLCVIKHYYIKTEKVKPSYVSRLARAG